MSFEQKINQKLNRYPVVKRIIKRVYQRIMYTISPKIKYEGDIVPVSPNDFEHEYFFGYYDKSPEDASNKYVICLKAKNTWNEVAPSDPAEIILIDTEKNISRFIAVTHAWNVQQGCMAQWIGPDFDKEIIYNDFRDGKYVSVILNVFTGQERVLAVPVYSVASDGSFALSLDFSRLHRLRPGYGYANIKDATKGEKIPDGTCIWKLNIKDNVVTPILKYADFVNFETRPEMKGAEHKVNHIMISPDGKRFMVLHRWLVGKRKYSRLVTVNVDGDEMYNLSDDDMISHCYWKDNQNIIAFENKKGIGAGYYLMKDKTQIFTHLWPYISVDGHPSYSSDGRFMVTDTYPNSKRIASINIMNGKMINVVAKVFAPFKYDNDTRCDLHPRWGRNGRRIYFDSVFEGHRGLYCVNLHDGIYNADNNMNGSKSVSVIIPCYNAEKTIQYTLESLQNQTSNEFEVIIVNDGSTDKTLSIIEKFAAKFKVKIINQKNRGVSAARNLGIDLAEGEYITFLDADDMYYPQFIEIMLEEIRNSNVDIVLSRYERCSEYSCVFENRDIEKVWAGKEEIYEMYNHKRIYRFNFFNAIYKKKIITDNHLLFSPGIKYGEDSLFFLQYLFYCNRGGIITNGVLYKYMNSGSTASSARNIQRMQIIECFLQASHLWETEESFDKSIGIYSIDRAIWAQAKDFAVEDALLFYKLEENYDVLGSMKRMARNCDEKMVKISAGIYVINVRLFIYMMKMYDILRK